MENFVTLQEAATFLGVSRATLRNWDKEGKLKANRNKLNGYRIYQMDKLIQLKRDMGGESADKSLAFESKSSVVPDTNKIRGLIGKLNRIIRDNDSESNILSRFDEISKLLFVSIQSGDYLDFESSKYPTLVKSTYKKLIQEYGIKTEGQFGEILLSEKTLLETGDVLSEIDFLNIGIDLKGLAYEELIKGTFDKNDNQQFFTPFNIVDFAVSLLGDSLSGVVCDPASGTGGFLTRAIKKNKALDIIGIEIDKRLSWITELNLIIHGSKSYTVNSFQDGGSLGDSGARFDNQVDIVITNPPFGSDYKNEELLNKYELGRGKVSRRRGVLFLEKIYQLLKTGGIASVVIDQGVLNSTSNVDVREFLLDNFEILAVIDLPECSFQPYATVSTSILIIKKSKSPINNRTFYAKAKNVGRKSNGEEDFIYNSNGKPSLNSDFPTILNEWEDFRHGRNQFDSGTFVVDLDGELKNDSTKRLDYTYHHPYRNRSTTLLNSSRYPVYSLSELCEERNISYIPAADSEVSSIKFTGLANIESKKGTAIQVVTPSQAIKSAVKRYEEDDIIFSKMRPNLRKISHMTFEDGGFVSSECAVLTVRRDSNGQYLINPALLADILRSDFVYGQIMSKVTGIGRPRIGMRDLRNIKLPVPPIEVQNQAFDVLQSARTSSRIINEKAMELLNESKNIEQSALVEATKILTGGE